MKKLILTILLLFCASSAFATTKYFMNGGVNNNWVDDTNWSTTSSAGPNNTTHAVAGDAAILDAGSPNCTISTAAACTSVNCTGYTGTFTMNANMTTTGSVTLVAGMTFTPNTYTWNMGCNGSTLTSGGKSFYNLNFNVSGTITLTDACDVSNILSVANAVWSTLATSDITCGGLTVTGSGIIAGTGRTITMTGGTWNHPGFDGSIRCNLTFAGNVTVSGTCYFRDGTLTYSSGTITKTSSTLILSNACTINTSGMSWNNVIMGSSGGVIIFTSDFDVNGNLTIPTGNFPQFTTGNITVAGNLTITGTGYIVSASQTIIMDGSGTWSSAGGHVRCNLTFNTTGDIVVSGTVYFRHATMTYITANSFTTTGSTLSLEETASTLNTNGISWNNITTDGSGITHTLSSALDINGNLTIGANDILACGTNQVNLAGNLTNNHGANHWRTGNNTFVFDGTTTIAGATSFYNFTINPGSTVHLTSTQVFPITNVFTANGTSGSHIVLDAVTGGSDAHLDPAGATAVTYVDATDIDSASGGAVTDTGGSVTSCVNWTYVAPPSTGDLLIGCEF